MPADIEQDSPAEDASRQQVAPAGAAAPASPRGPRGARKWIFRLLAATVVPVVFFVLLELTLRWAGFGFETDFFVPLDAKVSGRDARTTNQKYAWRFFPPTGARSPAPARFAASKPPGTYRIFVLGGSAAMGSPEPAFGFSRVLQAMLRRRYPGARFEVINTAMEAINSHVVREIAAEAADYDADLFVVYLGNNEVVGPYGLSDTFAEFSPSLRTIRASLWVKTTRLGQLLSRAVRRIRVGGRVEVWRGMETFIENTVAEDDSRLQQTVEHFRRNLLDVLDTARAAGVGVIVCSVATNLRDCAPFASMHRQGLSAADRSRWDALVARGISCAKAGRADEVVEAFGQAAKIDDRFAELHYRLAQAYFAGGRYDQARRHFTRARDLDTLRFRADSRINQAIRAVADERRGRGVYFVDAERAAAEDDPNAHGLPGRELFLEHCHMTFRGHYTVAAAVFRQVAAILPEAIRGPSAGAVEPPDLAECERLLALTGWERYRLARAVERVTARPPFTSQFDHAEWRAIRRAEVERLRPWTRGEVKAETLAAYAAALKRDADDVLLRANFALCLHTFREHDRAVEQWRTLLKLLPGNAAVHKNFGLGLMDAGRFDEAVEQLDASLAILPNDLDAQSNVGVSRLMTGRLDEAIGIFRRVLAANADHADARTNLAISLARQGKTDQAAEQFRTVLRERSDHVGALRNLAKLLAGQGKTDEAIRRYREALAAGEDFSVHLDLAGLLTQAKRPAESMKHCRRAVELAPHVAATHWMLGRALLANRQYADAVEALTRAVAIDDRLAEAHRDLGIAYQRMRRIDRATTHYAKAVALRPTDWATRERLAYVLLARGKHAEAVTHYEQVLAVQPRRAGAHNNIAVALSKLDRLGEAVMHFAAAVKLEPNALRHYNLATRLVRLGRDRDAVVHFRRALAKRPAWSEALGELAWVLATSDEAAVRNGHEALRLARQACTFTRFGQADMVDALAAALAEVGEFDQAVAAARKAHELARAAGQAQMASRIARRVRLYEARKPCRRGAREIK